MPAPVRVVDQTQLYEVPDLAVLLLIALWSEVVTEQREGTDGLGVGPPVAVTIPRGTVGVNAEDHAWLAVTLPGIGQGSVDQLCSGLGHPGCPLGLEKVKLKKQAGPLAGVAGDSPVRSVHVVGIVQVVIAVDLPPLVK